MAFAETYAGALNANLQDDEHHHAAGVLRAAAFADSSARGIGALLHRVKYGTAFRKEHEGDANALARLNREWLAIVDKKGRERNWIRAKDWPNIGHLFPKMAERVATTALAHYLDGICEPCGGTGTQGAKGAFKACQVCTGSRKAKITGLDRYETGLAEGMIGELEALESAHAGAASALLRRAA
jgi:hypothetical protein